MMTRYITLCTALALLACSADKDTDTGDTGDTGSTEDTGENTDTGEDTGTEDTGISEYDISFDIQGDFAGVSFSLVEISMENDQGSGPSFGLPMGEGLVEDTTYSLTVGAPENLIDDSDIGASVKLYVPVLINDVNDNHIHDQNTELIVGFGPNAVIYIQDMVDGSYDDGYYYFNLLEFMSSDSAALPTLMPATNVPVSLNLSPIEAISLAGTSTLPSNGTRLTVVSSLDLEAAFSDPLADIAVGPNWSLDLTGPPAANHRFGANEEPFIEMAVELPIVYTDMNNNEMRDSDESPVSILCRDDKSVSFMWFEDCFDLSKAFVFFGMGGSPGWHAVYEDPDSDMLSVLPEPEYTTLEIGEACMGDVIVNDVDGDGFTEQDGDCNDNDASINPDAFDIPNDGIDQDCEGGDSNNPSNDQDGDGFFDVQQGGSDCNDQDSSINPGATEVDNDGVDQDCDGNDNAVSSAKTWLDVEPLFQAASCMGCHGSSGGLTVNYNNLLNGSHGPSGLAYVDPGSPSTSYLWLKLTDTQGSVMGGGGNVMPPSGQMQSADLNTVEEWITGGALQQ